MGILLSHRPFGDLTRLSESLAYINTAFKQVTITGTPVHLLQVCNLDLDNVT